MKYFLHDTSAFQDEKITELFMEYGYEGLGLFYTILEKIALQEKPIKTKILKNQLQINRRTEKIFQFLEKIGLVFTKNEETFNERLLSYSKKYQTNREKNNERVSQYREKQKIAETVTNDTPITETECNAEETLVNKVKKESKVKEESKEEVSPSDWNFIKKDFFNQVAWREKFVIDKNIPQKNLESKLHEFINDLELKGEYKEVKELKSHFTNWFNKNQKNGIPGAKSTTRSEGQRKAVADLLRTGQMEQIEFTASRKENVGN